MTVSERNKLITKVASGGAFASLLLLVLGWVGWQVNKQTDANIRFQEGVITSQMEMAVAHASLVKVIEKQESSMVTIASGQRELLGFLQELRAERASNNKDGGS